MTGVVPIFRRYVRVPALLAGFVALVLAGALLTDPVTSERAELASARAQHTFTQLSSTAALRKGTHRGTTVSKGTMSIGRTVRSFRYAGTRWSYARWTSQWVSPGQSFTELIPTWNATTPRNSHMAIHVRVKDSSGRLSKWKRMARWATWDAGFRLTSDGSQRDTVARVATDTLVASNRPLTAYQLRATLSRKSTTRVTPRLRAIQAVASRPATTLPATSRRLLPARELSVPRYSQMIHRGQYPQFGGGGEAWCSPTSLSMVLGYYRALPRKSVYGWVDKRYADPWVDHLARAVYDYGYRGAGNWAFNTAYASNRTADAFVTRLTDLREAERFIAAGIPLVASISFGRGQLSGAPISSTPGHLVVIVGFTSTGKVIVNDPAAYSNSTVRRVYDRGQFERAWLRKSSGTVYVIRDAAHPLPKRTSRAW